MDSGTAVRIGLVTEVVEDAELRSRALEVAHAVARADRPTLMHLNAIYDEARDSTAAAALRREEEAQPTDRHVSDGATFTAGVNAMLPRAHGRP